MYGPLNKVRILDLTHTLAGLGCSMFLADMGAEVIAIEPKEHGAKGFGSRIATHLILNNIDLRYVFYSRNKKNLTLNLKEPRGKEIFFKLVQKSDVVINNFRPSVLQRLGINHEKLSETNPRIISCSITGFNSHGPYKETPCIDHIAQAIGGLLSLVHEQQAGPLFLPFYIADLSTSLVATIGILGALYNREKEGEGQQVECTLLSTALFLLLHEGTRFLNSGDLPHPISTKSRIPVIGNFKTKDDYIAVGAITESHWQGLCRVIGEDQLLTDQRYNSQAKRVENSASLYKIIEEKLSTRDSDYWIEAFNKADIPVAPINNLNMAFADPRVKAENMVVDITYQGKKVKILDTPLRLSKFRERSHSSPPELGEHNQSILESLLSLSPQQVQDLKRDGII